MSIDELQYREIKQLIAMFGGQADKGPWELGKAYLIRTVTMIQTGDRKSVV